MSVATTLFALVIAQGPNIVIEPGAECTQQYKGGHVGCYNPDGSSWTGFFSYLEPASA
jgi:hypothetical protein